MLRMLPLPAIVLTALACFILFAAPAHAGVSSEGLSGSDLLGMCNSKYDTDYGFCAGYVSAIANAMLISPVSGEHACSHGPIRSQQLIDLYRSYAELFPENLRGAAAKNVAVAIARGFPCND